jgi:hypothetical protein
MMNEVETLLNNEVIRSNMIRMDEIDKMYEYFVTKNNMEEFIDFLRENCYLCNLRYNILVNIGKILKLDYRKFKNGFKGSVKDITAANMFAGIICGYFTEDILHKVSRLYANFKFNKTNFNCQYNLDLACKIIENKVSKAEKAEAIILFNDIKERLIAA